MLRPKALPRPLVAGLAAAIAVMTPAVAQNQTPPDIAADTKAADMTKGEKTARQAA